MTNIEDVLICFWLMGLLASRVLEQNCVHVTAGILKKSIAGIENNQGYFTVTKNAQFVSFLHKTPLSFGKSNLQKYQNFF